MTTNKTLIVYIAYGPDHLHKQVIFSILTLYYFLNIKGEFEKINLIVFTDKKEAFEKSLNGISIIYEILTPQEIKEYIGIREFKHIHRLKIFVLKHCFQKYKSNLLYIDGDTYFLKSPVELINKISNNTSIFHAKEFELSKENEYGGGKSLKFGYDPIKLLSSVIKKINSELHEKDYQLDMNVEMWNAGVLGISFNNHTLLDDVLKLTDRISKKTSYFLAEQFAFSYILFKKTALMPAYEFIYHYWPEDSKEVYSSCINTFLQKDNDITITGKAEKSVELAKQLDQLLLHRKTKQVKITKRLQKIKKLKKNKISFSIYHLSLQFTNFCRYWFRAILIPTKK